MTASRLTRVLLQPTAVHVYEVRPGKDHRGVDLISDALSASKT
jgi:hypothetical protein